MTVHGSKGLEAPIVIMPDTGKRLLRMTDQIVENQDIALWNSAGATAPDAVRLAREAKADAQREERMRLLYVAMTRAEKWLIVAAAGDLDKSGDTWYQTIEAGMKHLGAEPYSFAEGQGLRYEHGDWSGALVAETARASAQKPDLPAFFKTPAPQIKAEEGAISPSDLGGAKALPGEAGLDEEAAKKRGRQIHLLLEHLADEPTGTWPELAPRILENAGEGADDWSDLLAEASQVLNAPHHRHLFDAKALAEVSLTAKLGDQTLHGTIDRLIVTETEVLAVDFKTNAVVPQNLTSVPDGLLRQMGAYAEALKQIYPDKIVKTALLWTKTGEFMSLPDALITEALTQALGNVYPA
jgi:ATP-dependent helicase/nuclease subunit A